MKKALFKTTKQMQPYMVTDFDARASTYLAFTALGSVQSKMDLTFLSPGAFVKVITPAGNGANPNKPSTTGRL